VPVPPPIETVLPLAQREKVRATWLAEGGFYNPWLHIGTTTVFGCSVMAVAATLLQNVRWWEVAFGFGLLIASNAVEWRIHRDILHKRRWPFQLLYDKHTPLHHMVFVTDDMAIRSASEFRLVLIPAYGIVFAFASLVPAMIAIWVGGPQQHNLAAIFAIETMGYIVSYEWLHLSYHLPENTFIGGLSVIKVLRRHHAIHHDPRLMQKWNFNVSLPLWDLVRRTYVRDPGAVIRPRAA